MSRALVALARELGQLLVVVGAAEDRLLEDRRVGGDAAQRVLADHPLELARLDQAAPDLVEPDARAGLGQGGQPLVHSLRQRSYLLLLSGLDALRTARRACSATFSGVNPKCSKTSLAGAEAPKRGHPDNRRRGRPQSGPSRAGWPPRPRRAPRTAGGSTERGRPRPARGSARGRACSPRAWGRPRPRAGRAPRRTGRPRSRCRSGSAPDRHPRRRGARRRRARPRRRAPRPDRSPAGPGATSAKAVGCSVCASANSQASAVSLASAGRSASRLGIARSAASCSTGWCVGPSSPRPIESCV